MGYAGMSVLRASKAEWRPASTQRRAVAKCGRAGFVEGFEAKYGILIVSTAYSAEFTVTVIVLVSFGGVAIVSGVDAVI